MSEFTNCKNCGKQNIILGEYNKEDKCSFCGKPVGIKVPKDGTMENSKKPTVKASQAPPAEPPVEAEPTPGEAPASETTTMSSEELLEPAPVYISPKPPVNRGVRKWKKRCKDCENGYFHDEQFWCSKKHCPKKCPKHLRPQYRPKISEGQVDRLTAKKVSDGQPAGKLPPLPPFNESWSDPVKVAWLNAYSRVKKKE